MFDSKVRCPNCRATTLIRDVQIGAYMPGERKNCQFDRREELPAGDKPAVPPPGASTEGKPAEEKKEFVLPEGGEALSGNRYKLPDGKIVHGKALAAAMGGGENA